MRLPSIISENTYTRRLFGLAIVLTGLAIGAFLLTILQVFFYQKPAEFRRHAVISLFLHNETLLSVPTDLDNDSSGIFLGTAHATTWRKGIKFSNLWGWKLAFDPQVGHEQSIEVSYTVHVEKSVFDDAVKDFEEIQNLELIARDFGLIETSESIIEYSKNNDSVKTINWISVGNTIVLNLAAPAAVLIWPISLVYLHGLLKRARDNASLNECRRCGYSMKGLSMQNACPECGYIGEDAVR